MKCQNCVFIGLVALLSVGWHVTSAELRGDELDRIEPGVGWKAFRVGATRNELIDSLGQPDQDSTERYLKWNKDLKVNCLIDDNRGAFELRFNAGFKGELEHGIQIGSNADAITSGYGLPDDVQEKAKATKYVYLKKGVLFWTSKGKVMQIVIFQPKA